MKKIVLATYGSFGDLHPYLACGLALKARGFNVVIATHAHYQEKVTSEGLGFHSLKPGPEEHGPEENWIAKATDLKKGSEYVFRNLMVPWVEESFHGLMEATSDACLLISHPLALAGPLVAAKRNIPWLSLALQPSLFMSATDPSLIPQALWLNSLRPFGPLPFKVLYALGKKMTRAWVRPVDDLRLKLGLPPSPDHPIFDAQFSPYGTLCLFSRFFIPTQKDWPLGTKTLGFAFYDKDKSSALSSEVTRYLAAGEPPVVFTLGTSAVKSAGDFYDQALEGARTLGIRAIFLVGQSNSEFALKVAAMPEFCVSAYEPFSALFPLAKAVVHQAGAGTVAQVLRAGVPQLCVPYAFDQPDNAARVASLGVGRIIPRQKFSSTRLVKVLGELLTSSDTHKRAKDLAKFIATENFEIGLVESVEKLVGGSVKGL